MEQGAKKYYETTLEHCNRQIERYEKLLNIYALFRLLAFLAGIFLIYKSLAFNLIWATELAIFFSVMGFGLLVKRRSLLEKRKKYFIDLRTVNSNEVSVINGGDNIYPDGSQYLDITHPYTSDLDIFGRRSLFARINRCATARGNNKLAAWLNGPAAAEVIRQRQGAVKELALKVGWTQDLQTLLLFSNKTEDRSHRLFEYLRVAPPRRSAVLKMYVSWAPWLFLAAAAAAWFISWFIYVLIALAIVNGVISRFHASETARAAGLIGKMSDTLAHFHDAIQSIKKEEWRSSLCISLAAHLKDTAHGKLSQQLRKLSMLIRQMEMGKMGIVGLLLSLGACWDVRQMLALEDWKTKNELSLEDTFDIIADFEALISLSMVHTNNPGWCFAEISNDYRYTLSAKDIGHPLIPEHIRVANDFELHNELKIDIITGSNMAGKSTFLRTLGVNCVLALCGSPVCAAAFKLTPMLVFSYMRITDSLNESTSTFKAELDRLKLLLASLDGDEKVYFLIDEMLRGTNSADKYLGSKAVIEKLIAKKAVGIVATHDLQIAELEQKYPDYIRNFYFDIQVEGDEMKFDYKLKSGACKTFNAFLLLRRLGIEIGGY